MTEKFWTKQDSLSSKHMQVCEERAKGKPQANDLLVVTITCINITPCNHMFW